MQTTLIALALSMVSSQALSMQWKIAIDPKGVEENLLSSPHKFQVGNWTCLAGSVAVSDRAEKRLIDCFLPSAKSAGASVDVKCFKKAEDWRDNATTLTLFDDSELRLNPKSEEYVKVGKHLNFTIGCR